MGPGLLGGAMRQWLDQITITNCIAFHCPFCFNDRKSEIPANVPNDRRMPYQLSVRSFQVMVYTYSFHGTFLHDDCRVSNAGDPALEPDTCHRPLSCAMLRRNTWELEPYARHILLCGLKVCLNR